MVRKHNQDDYEKDIHEERTNDSSVRYCDYCGRRLSEDYIEDEAYGTSVRIKVFICENCN